MMRDFKSVRRISGKNEEIENIPQYPIPSSSASSSLDSSRAPLNAIQEPEISAKGKADRTPAKPKCRNADSTLPLRTPEKLSLGFNSRSRYGWAELGEESRVDISSYSTQARVPVGNANIATPRITRTVGRAYSNYSESTSTQNTPTKSVNKPPSTVGFRNKVDVNGGGRLGNFAALYKGIPSSGAPTCVVNTVEVPHFDLKEDPSFWMDHNVQVLIRVRPLNSMERSALGYNRCLKQESAQTVTWIAQPETRFTFDHVASESVDQDTLFRMVGLPMVENCLSGYNSCMFAYGQTGSGKTYTMLGEIEDLEQKPSVHRGMTPRIFEFLFARIQAEEESRSDERLKYNCKCSFLEIYNEQITDLLDPSSTNLMLREDSKNGVYVENLSEFEVQTVSDILRLLTQGSSNRKVAATNMNRESSRSHCVFTCVIESSWEKDSTSNLRFARLNLVDLAGSERQKTSGAEGDRLKEAANINKSLSTLGHVIMVLVDIAHGRPRHIPYRDSRLTFLLQDSLGGNSKTIIVANVSPSMSCAAETFNTLKFAQRAKLIQNNAVVNEDSTGDVQALQRQIRLLKAELAALKSQNVSRCLSFGAISMNDKMSNHSEADQHQQDDLLAFESKGVIRMSTEQLKSLETTLGGALRREQIADVSIRQLQDEIEQLKHLVKKREEENMRTKMTLKFREDRIHRMESMVAGSISSDAYILEENRALSEEIQLLQAKIDSHPEVTRFATENIRLRNELLRFQEFYEEGERESLLAEVSNLRNQLLKCTTDADSEQQAFTRFSLLPQEAMEGKKENGSFQMELESTLKQLEECRNNLNGCLEENTKLSRELDDLRSMFGKYGFRDSEDLEKNPSGEMPMELCMDDEEDHKEMDQEKSNAQLSKSNAEEIIALQLELDIIKTILEEERASKIESEERALRFYRDLEQTREDLSSMTNLYEDANSELKEVKCVIEALESQQVHSINELEELQKSNDHYKKLLSMKEMTSRRLRDEAPKEEVAETEECPLRVRLNNMQLSLEKAKQRFLNEDEMDQVRRQAEIEAAEVIVSMQEELAILQQQVLDSEIKETETKKGTMLLEAEVQKLNAVNEENKQLSFLLEEKDHEIYALSEEWKMLTCEMEEVLSNGHEAIDDAANELESISEKRVWISEHLSQMVRMLSEKEFHIEELSSCLEDVNNRRNDLENMLKSLRGATLVITEAHQQECIEKEALILSMNSELEAKTYEFENMENRLKLAEDNIRSLTLCSTAAFVVVNRLSEVNAEHVDELKLKGSLLSEQATNIEASEKQIECLQEDLARLENTCAVLREQVFEEKKHVSSMQQKLEIMEEEGILQARDKLNELNSGVCSLRSSMDMHSEVEKENAENYPEKCMEFSDCSPRECAQEFLCEATPESEGNSKGTCDRDVTVSLLKREVESAIDNLKQVQAEMVKLQSEKEERLIFEKQNKDTVNCLVSQVFNLQAAIDSFEEQSKSKIKTFKDKLQSFEESVMEVGNEWCKAKQLHEHEVEDAVMAVAQKSAEASFILVKFEEAQETLKEADLMINELVIANEAVKIDIERQKIVEKSLLKDKDKLMKEVESMKSINAQRDEDFEILEKQFLELEGIVSEISSSSMEGLVLLAKELSNVRSTALNSTKSLKSWLEEIWSEIIVRDCAVSSLHLCHMGILLETVTGLNAENGLLQRGLRESNSAMSNLREHNSRSRKELEACSVLKGKLLSDIKNGFDRISKKERETVDLGKKIISFEQKVSEMQLQEEMMLERSNSIGSQLAVLTKELDLSNQSAVASLLDQEKFMHSGIENFMLLSCSRDLEAFVLAKEMEDGNLVIVEKLVEEVIFAKVDAEMKEQILLDFENDRTVLVEDAERTRLDLLMKLNESKSRIAELGGVVKSLQDGVKSKNDVVCENQKLKDEVAEITDAKMRLVSQIQSLESEYESLKMDMEALRDEKSLVFQDLAEQKTKCESSSTSIEALNKEAAELKNKVADLEAVVLKDKVVIFELHQENQKLQGDINGLREEYESLGMEMEELRDEKSLVFQDLAEQKSKCESSSTSIEALNKETDELKNKVADLEAVVLKDKIVIFELHQENEKLQGDINGLREEYESLGMEMEELRDEKSLVFQDLAEQKTKCESSSTSIEALNKETTELKNKVADLEAVALKDKTVIFELHQENEKLQGDINGLREEYKSLGMEMEELRDEKSLVLQDLAEQKTKCESSSTSIEALNKETAELKNKVADLEAVALKDKIVIFELHQENEKLQGNINGLREEYKSLGMEMEALRDEKSLVFQDLAEQKSKCESSSTYIEALNKETDELKNKVADLEAVGLKEKTVIFELHQENEKLQGDINGLREEYESLGMEMVALRNNNSLVLQDLAEERSKCESSSTSIEALNREASELKNKVADLEAVVLTSKGLITKLNEEKQKLQDDVKMLKSENNVVLQELEDQKSKCESSSTSIDELNKEAVVLKINIAALETSIVGLQSELKLRNFELSELKDAQSLFLEELDLKNETLQECVDAVNSLQVENDLLKKNLVTAENGENEFLLSDSKSFELADEMLQRSNWTSKLIEELECANTKSKEILHENLNLQAELARKDEIQEGLVFDLRLLQESASNVQDQKDELEEMAASLEALEDEIEGITAELDRAVANGEMLEAQLNEKTEIISALKLDLVKEADSVKFLKEENTELKASAEETIAAKISLEEDLAETRNLNESLEMELEQVNDSIDCLKNDLDRLTIQRDELNNEVSDLKEELQKAHDAALKSEAIAVEAQQIAEANDILAHEKDEEVSLLERSVKELECTINVLENKVDIVQGEAERQRLLREELESELHSVKIQMDNVRNADADMKLHFDEKKAELEDALKQIEILERDAAQKDAEVSQCKAHISELNLHAEAQANEYKLKYKELEVMAEQVRAEGSSNSSSNQMFNSIPSKSEKNGPKPRGSGSPFKCIGLGMAQQIKSEKDEEYSSLRQRIDELESIVISKQREIFALNSKLASAESMTHDVIRDLLGVKLDMSSYASLMDSQGDTIQGQFSESQLPDTIKLKDQLNEFVEERHKWLREMEQKQAELISTEIALEKLRQHEQLLKTENDMLKMENSNYRKKSVELEEEVTKLSEQQNLVHRINHHAKIKDENNMLKARNEDLSNKLQQADSVISQVKEELASYRASLGKVPQIDFDEEQLWKDKLKESEEERIKLAEKLLTLCTSILRAAGFKRRVTHSSVTIAEEVLDQLKNKINSMQSELNDLKTKNKIYREQIRMSELRSQQTGMSLKSDENRRSRTPKRTTRASFVSNLDR